jgi:hypothetical protein
MVPKYFFIFTELACIYYKELILGVVKMPLLTLLITCPFIFAVNSKKHEQEAFVLAKLFGIWILSLAYITINDNFRIPVGIICAILIVYKAKTNKKSKLAALLVGIISLILSSLVYLTLKI